LSLGWLNKSLVNFSLGHAGRAAEAIRPCLVFDLLLVLVETSVIKANEGVSASAVDRGMLRVESSVERPVDSGVHYK
jgi:hypothetical protein